MNRMMMLIVAATSMTAMPMASAASPRSLPAPPPAGPGMREAPPAPAGSVRRMMVMQRRQAALAPEDARAAWAMEARSAARALALDEERSARLVIAYVDARERLRETLRDELGDQRRDQVRDRRRDGSGDRVPDRWRDRQGAPDAAGPGRPQGRRGRGVGAGRGAGPGLGGPGGAGLGPAGAPPRRGAGVGRELVEAERAALGDALAAFLGPEQVDRAMASLGSFGRRWDRMVHAVAALDLGAERTAEALGVIEAHVASRAAVREAGARAADPAARREARERLLGALQAILSDDEWTRLRETMRPDDAGRPRRPLGGPEDAPRRRGPGFGGGRP